MNINYKKAGGTPSNLCKVMAQTLIDFLDSNPKSIILDMGDFLDSNCRLFIFDMDGYGITEEGNFYGCPSSTVFAHLDDFHPFHWGIYYTDMLDIEDIDEYIPEYIRDLQETINNLYSFPNDLDAYIVACSYLACTEEGIHKLEKFKSFRKYKNISNINPLEGINITKDKISPFLDIADYLQEYEEFCDTSTLN